jgi:glycosyltransferase involved in cell wall biosynthesis
MNEFSRHHREIATHRPDLRRYPIDMFPFLSAPYDTRDEAGVLYTRDSASGTALYHPIHIAQFALAHWNVYMLTGNDEHKEAFIAQALWLLDHEARLSGDTGGWPLPLSSLMPRTNAPSRPVLSALAQGNGISVLVRAYQLTENAAFLQAAHRVIRTFELDILDGGINTPIGDNGICFEEIGVYPASHSLRGSLFALFGLYDYREITQDRKLEPLIQCSLATFHILIDAFDTSYWTYCDLLHKPFASRFEHSLHVLLLAAFAEYTHCDYCAALAKRWATYQQRFTYRLRYLISSSLRRYAKNILNQWVRRPMLKQELDTVERVCVPITGFPIPGGMKSVLAGVALAMGKHWRITYLTNYKGREVEGLDIKISGWGRVTSPWQFPTVWLYCLSGGYTLFRLLSNGPGCSLILPQDGLYSAAFAAVPGKLLGTHVVCMDHGSVTFLANPAFQRERMEAITTSSQLRWFLACLQFTLYWSSVHLLVRLATPWIDHFLIAGDEVEEVYRKKLGVHVSRITRYAYIVDVTHFPPLKKEVRAKMRMEREIPDDAIVITLINRLVAAKGLSFALEGIALALAELSTTIRERVRVLIAGDGPLRSQVEADIARYDLGAVCILWGEANSSDVITLLGLSDIFLYSGIRGTNYSMAVLEAMAAGCAVVASVSPQSNARLLAEGRGIAVASADAHAIGAALRLLCKDRVLRHQMGQAARAYIATYHSMATLRRTLLRVSHFVPSLQEEC